MASHIAELVERYTELQAAQKADDEAHADYRARRKERNAELKELKASMAEELASDYDQDEVVVGDRVLTRVSKPRVLCTVARVKQHLGVGYDEYVDSNVEMSDQLKITKQKTKKRRVAV